VTPAEIRERLGEGLDLESLGQAFERFTASAEVLEGQQAALRKRIAALDIELAEANDQLSASLATQSALATDLHNVLENLSAGVVAVDTEGRVRTVNGAALSLLGRGSGGDLIGRHALGVLGPSLGSELIEEMVASDWTPARTVDIDLTMEGSSCAPPQRRLRLRAAPARDVETGDLCGGLLMIEDITDLMRWRERALLNERLSTMGRVAAQVAHEIRNPLGSIELLASALACETEAISDHAGELAGHIVASVKTLDSLVSNILLFARGREPEVAPVTWEAIAESALDQVRPAVAQAGVEIRKRWADSPVAVLGDSDLLTQAVVNLLINATQALAESERRVIALETGARGDERWIRVSDAGPGVPPELRDRIFDPFITTRRRGTGLGLAIVSHIISAHGGRIACLGSEEGGAAFEMALPQAEEATVSTVTGKGRHG
jgi:nitrogen fixation/metabolism regulation signal transduction histidine kinase